MLGVFWVVCNRPIVSELIVSVCSGVEWWSKTAGIGKLINGNTGAGSAAKGAFRASSEVQPVLTLPVACRVLFMLLYFAFPALKGHIFSSFGPYWFLFQSFYLLAFTPRWTKNTWEMDAHGSNLKAPSTFPPLI